MGLPELLSWFSPFSHFYATLLLDFTSNSLPLKFQYFWDHDGWISLHLYPDFLFFSMFFAMLLPDLTSNSRLSWPTKLLCFGIQTFFSDADFSEGASRWAALVRIDRKLMARGSARWERRLKQIANDRKVERAWKRSAAMGPHAAPRNGPNQWKK